MTEAWFIARGDGIEGPVDDDALRELARLGALSPADRVWHERLVDWTPARRVHGLFPSPSARVAPPRPAGPRDARTIDQLLGLAWWSRIELWNSYARFGAMGLYALLFAGFLALGPYRQRLLGDVPLSALLAGFVATFAVVALGGLLSLLTSYRLARLLRLPNPGLVAVGVLYCISFSTLAGPFLILYASRRLALAGVRFGLLGPNREDVERLTWGDEGSG